jgi:hypothetical protein
LSRSISRAAMNWPSRSFSCCITKRLNGMLRSEQPVEGLDRMPATTLLRSAWML